MLQNPKNNIEDIYELTPMQQGMLYHTLYKEGSDAYIEQFIFDIAGDLDKDVFRKSWEYAVSRHGVLRTSFQWKGISKPVQIVNKTAELPWADSDWSDSGAEEIEAKFDQFLKQDRQLIFSMEKVPLMRCTLIKTGQNRYKFIWTYHHILLDGWSYPIIQSEVFKTYEALKEGKEPDLQKPLSYKNFILWLNEKDKSPLRDFWKKELRGFYSPTPMVTKGKSPEKQMKGQTEIGIEIIFGTYSFSSELCKK